MITLKPIANVHHFDQHMIFINIDNQPELSHCLNNPFALSEDSKTFQFRQVDPQAAAQAYRMHLWALIQRKGEAYKQLIKLAKASKSGKWVELSYATEQKHAEVLAKCLAWLEEDVTPEEPIKIAPKYQPASALEGVIGFLDDDDQERWPEDLEQMYMPFVQPVAKAEDHDVPLNMITWITGKRLTVLAYMQDDHTAILPSGAMVELKEYKTRFAKHKIGRLAHVQRTLAKAYNDYYENDQADWDYSAELIPSSYDHDLASRYESDIDPENENNYDHDTAIDYVALAAADGYTGGIVGKEFNYISLDQLDRINEVYVRTGGNKPLKVRTITDQAKGSPRRTYATKAQVQEYRRHFA
ncbi:MAG: hypothetical protein H6641_16055 [Caldilineaceae bacterium]|nr:hypothetical protein [Caldilineaceae bacterium]